MLLTIPYDKGWTFKINGQPITSTKAAGSFTAIEVPAGHSVITAEYQVPGLRIGSIGTLTSIALLMFLFSRRQQQIPIL